VQHLEEQRDAGIAASGSSELATAPATRKWLGKRRSRRIWPRLRTPFRRNTVVWTENVGFVAYSQMGFILSFGAMMNRSVPFVLNARMGP
jgi:hypothetical protein